MTLGQWKESFLRTIRRHEYSSLLREAAVQECMGDWTKCLTDAVIESCESLGWKASAKGHQLQHLPISHYEYLTLDIIAFGSESGRWPFPIAVMELENSPAADRIAYSLWKVLAVRSPLRVVFCYRRTLEEGSVLVRFLQDEVIMPMGLSARMALDGDTLVVVGSRDESTSFPYGFFRWWLLDWNTGTFNVI